VTPWGIATHKEDHVPSKRPQLVAYLDPADMKRLEAARASASRRAGIEISRSAYAKIIIRAHLSPSRKRP